MTAPFRTDPELGGKVARLEWRTIRRIFFQFIDDISSLKTSNKLAYLSGLAFYAFIDLATISITVYFVSAIPLAIGLAAHTTRWFMLGLLLLVAVSIIGARAAIKKHKNTSNRQLDAILSEHYAELRQKLSASVS